MDFRLFGPSNTVVLAITLLGSVFMVWLLRSKKISEGVKMTFRRILAALLVLSALMDPICLLARNLAKEVIVDGLPLHLCDWAALLLGWVLWQRKPSSRAAMVGYLWGMSGTLNGLITPDLKMDFPTLDFFGFFLQHSGVPIASVAVIFGMKLYPAKGSLKIAVLWSWFYMAVAMLISLLIGANYGYFWHKPAAASLFDIMPPWPWYLLTLQLLGVTLYSFWLLVAKIGRHCFRDAR